MHVGIAADYPELDRGDGVCKYLDCTTKLCMIYNERPLLCNVDKAYQVLFKDQISIEEYYELNYKACKELKQKAKDQGVNNMIEKSL